MFPQLNVFTQINDQISHACLNMSDFGTYKITKTTG